MDEVYLPEWATGINEKRELRIGTQLCTRDGRRMGNARITDVTIKYGYVVYVCETDRGNILNLIESEITSLFHIGEWFVNIND